MKHLKLEQLLSPETGTVPNELLITHLNEACEVATAVTSPETEIVPNELLIAHLNEASEAATAVTSPETGWNSSK